VAEGSFRAVWLGHPEKCEECGRWISAGVGAFVWVRAGTAYEDEVFCCCRCHEFWAALARVAAYEPR
jgi:hypothetical protein